MIVKFRVRRDTESNWSSVNPVLGLGEPGHETDTFRTKYGDGTTPWNDLPYSRGAVAWGQISGTLSAQTDLQAALNGKEPTITAGTTGQYLRGDKSWAALDKAAVGLGNLSNVVTGSGDVVLATTPVILTTLNVTSTTIARVLYTSDSAGTPKTAQVQLNNVGDLVLRPAVGQITLDSFTGIVALRNGGASFATMLQVAATETRPGGDNTINLGTASFRWKEVFAGNATINTSDERRKQWLGGLTPAQLRAGLRIADEIGLFRWLDGNRVHVGVRAQQVARILIEEGVEAPQPMDFAPDVFVAETDRPSFAMAFLTFDTWRAVREPVMREVCVKRATASSPAQRDSVQRVATPSYRPKAGEVIDADGLVWRERPAGNVFGIRTGELALFLAACEAAERRRMAVLLEQLITPAQS